MHEESVVASTGPAATSARSPKREREASAGYNPDIFNGMSQISFLRLHTRSMGLHLHCPPQPSIEGLRIVLMSLRLDAVVQAIRAAAIAMEIGYGSGRCDRKTSP